MSLKAHFAFCIFIFFFFNDTATTEIYTLSLHDALPIFTRPDGSPPPAFGRFEAARPNEIWTGDALHGPVIGGRKTYLFAFIDDHSRLITGHRFGHAEDTVRLAAALRPALASRGVPERIYVDNGSAFVDSWLLRACASLGIKLVHSAPGRPRLTGQSRLSPGIFRDPAWLAMLRDFPGLPGVSC